MPLRSLFKKLVNLKSRCVTMSALDSFSTILILGGTGGIGESFARRFHAMGKKVIITGRRQHRLDALVQELPGLETFVLDNSDIPNLAKNAQALIAKYPHVDTVWVNAGIQYQGNFKSLQNFTDEKLIHEINTNYVGPLILARYFADHLQTLKRETHFLVTSSALAYVPMAVFPVYCSTKAAIHSFLIGLRDSLIDTNVSVIEIVAPYVRTDLDAANRFDKVATPMELDVFTDEILKSFEEKPAKEIKEVGAGWANNIVTAWRNAFASFLTLRKSRG